MQTNSACACIRDKCVRVFRVARACAHPKLLLEKSCINCPRYMHGSCNTVTVSSPPLVLFHHYVIFIACNVVRTMFNLQSGDDLDVASLSQAASLW